jgi:Mn-dependent DtxR family transcriptional regulator
MLAEKRRMKILELLREEGSARVRDLSKLFSVSEPTIRQDTDAAIMDEDRCRFEDMGVKVIIADCGKGG